METRLENIVLRPQSKGIISSEPTLQLSDLFYSYPELDPTSHDDLFQQKITAKKEFNEKGSLPWEKLPTRGESYNHQEMVHRYIIPYDELALFHRTGTGKTGASVGAGEKFRQAFVTGVKSYINNYIHPQRTYIRKVFIVVGNKPIKEQIKRQIACKISNPGEYEVETTKNGKRLTDDQIKGRINKELKKYYDVITYGEFVKLISTKSDRVTVTTRQEPPNEFTYYLYRRGKKATSKDGTVKGQLYRTVYQLRDKKTLIREFSGSMFILDEVQHLRGDIVNVFNMKQQSDFDESATDTAEVNRIRKNTKTRSIFRYNIIHKLFMMLKRIKRIVLTATPAINDPSEFRDIMNLILPQNLQIPRFFNWNTANLDTLLPYFKGRVSFVRETTAIVNSEYIGETPSYNIHLNGETYDSQSIIDQSIMSEPQTLNDGTYFIGQQAGYTNVRKTTGQSRPREGAFYGAELQALNFVFPDGSSGSSGYSKYVQTFEDGRIGPANGLQKWLKLKQPEQPSNSKHLAQLSNKFAKVVSEAKVANGNVFIFSRFVKGSGANVLSLSFRNNGFEEFRESSSVFRVEVTSISSGSFCPTPTSNKGSKISRSLRPGFKPKSRYALLTGSTTSRRFSIALETFNSWENRHGDLIKILIISPIGETGLDTANVVDIHILNPNWNEASTYQAISRAIRSGGHLDLWNELVEQAIRRAIVAGGRLDLRNEMETQAINRAIRTDSHLDLLNEVKARKLGVNTANISVPVKIHLHASVQSDEAITNNPSAEMMLYQLSEKKDRSIRRIFRYVKQLTIDCHIHTERNVKLNEVDGSSICDYNSCKYGCYDPLPNVIDYSSYDVLYIEEILEPIMNDIKEIYQTHTALSFLQLQRLLVSNAEARHLTELEELSYLGSSGGELTDMHNYLPKFIEMAISRLIQTQEPILNRNGLVCFMEESGDTIFIRDGFKKTAGSIHKHNLARDPEMRRNNNTNLGESMYTKYLIVVDNKTLTEYANVGNYEDVSVSEFRHLDVSNDLQEVQYSKLKNAMEKLNFSEQSILFEEAMEEFVNSDSDPEVKRQMGPGRIEQIQFLLKWFETVRSSFYEPVNQIMTTIVKIAELPTLSQETAQKELAKIIEDTNRYTNMSPEQRPEIVYINSLASIDVGQSRHAYLQKRRKADKTIRIYKPTEKRGWRDVTLQERPVYNRYLQAMDYNWRAPYEKYKVYGILDKDNTFYVVDNLRSSGNPGKNCKSYNGADLLEILWYLKAEAPPRYVAPDVTIDQIRAEVSHKYGDRITEIDDTDKMIFMYQYIKSERNVKAFCGEVRRRMEELEKSVEFIQQGSRMIWRL